MLRILEMIRSICFAFILYKALELLEMFGSQELETILCSHHWNLILLKKKYNTNNGSVA